MKQLLAGLLIGIVSTMVAFSCGTPPHSHEVADIKQSNSNNAGVCQCKEPTNTIVVKKIEVDCSNPVDVPGNQKGVFIGGVDPDNILGSLVVQKVKNANITTRASSTLFSDDKGSLYAHCERSFTLRLLLRK